MRRAGLAEPERLLRTQRRQPVEVAAPWGPVWVNDQKPLPRAGLLRCLDGIIPEDWYAELNERIFFFARVEAATRFSSVRASTMPARTLFSIDTKRLLDMVGSSLELSPINTGNAMRRPTIRSRASFLPIANYPLEEIVRRRGWARAVAEVSVRIEVLDLRPALIATYDV